MTNSRLFKNDVILYSGKEVSEEGEGSSLEESEEEYLTYNTDPDKFNAAPQFKSRDVS